MAGDWIKMRMDLPEDPAVFKLAALTKLDRFSVVGRLYAFWAWADKHAVDGHVDGATSHVVDSVVSFEGFADALVAVKWLVIDDDFIVLPHHERHNGESAKERSLKNARQARWREKTATEKAAKENDVDGGASTKASTREEKRREDIKPSSFDAFWTAYPKKVAKGDAEKAWSKIKPDADLLDKILKAVAAAVKSHEWTKDNGQYIPNPATWLNGKRWEDGGLQLVQPGSSDKFKGAK